jgi:hypothetical protein
MKWEPKGRVNFCKFLYYFKNMTNVEKTWIKTWKVVVHLKDSGLGIKYIISILVLDFLFDMILILSIYNKTL